MTVLAVYQQQYSNTNKSIFTSILLFHLSRAGGVGIKNKDTGGCKISIPNHFIPFSDAAHFYI